MEIFKDVRNKNYKNFKNKIYGTGKLSFDVII